MVDAVSAYQPTAGAAALAVMIIDDSIVARSILHSIVDDLPGFRVVACASSAERALATLDTLPVDVILLDLALPGMDGLTALPELLRRAGGARVLIVSGSAGNGADACVRALTLGATDTIEKPVAGLTAAFRTALGARLARLAAEPPALPPPSAAAPTGPVLAAPVRGRIGCVAVGASTGGLHALAGLFDDWPAACDAPILVTQHLPGAFMSYFAAQLSEMVGRPARVARSGDRVLPGTVLVAPGDAHLMVRAAPGAPRVALSREPAPSGCLPSVDPMFESVAAFYRDQAFGVVLSGMGRDGAIGARAIVAAGGEVAAQDRRTSTIWGMPGTVAAAGLAATVAEPARLARRVAQRVGAVW